MQMKTVTSDEAISIFSHARWSSDRAMIKGCLPLTFLRESEEADEWGERYVLATATRVLPVVLDKFGVSSLECREASTIKEAVTSTWRVLRMVEEANDLYLSLLVRMVCYVLKLESDSALRAASFADSVSQILKESDKDTFLRYAVSVFIACYTEQPIPKWSGDG